MTSGVSRRGAERLGLPEQALNNWGCLSRPWMTSGVARTGAERLGLPEQALNNWGLVLQELSSMRGPSEQRYLVHHSIAKFRRALRQRPEFDRACYNLGTVFYSHACALQAAASQALSSFLTQVPPFFLSCRSLFALCMCAALCCPCSKPAERIGEGDALAYRARWGIPASLAFFHVTSGRIGCFGIVPRHLREECLLRNSSTSL